MREAGAPLHIAVGVIEDPAGRILISERRADCAYAGKWEFPGGKVEPGDTVEQALQRELHEELGIEVHAARPLIRFEHRYTDRHVLLDPWRVLRYPVGLYRRYVRIFELEVDVPVVEVRPQPQPAPPPQPAEERQVVRSA